MRISDWSSGRVLFRSEPIAQQPSEQKTQTSEPPAKETPVKETITTEELEDLFNSAAQSIL
jgi:hypothetical protein